jgi:hypothetical protein
MLIISVKEETRPNSKIPYLCVLRSCSRLGCHHWPLPQKSCPSLYSADQKGFDCHASGPCHPPLSPIWRGPLSSLPLNTTPHQIRAPPTIVIDLVRLTVLLAIEHCSTSDMSHTHHCHRFGEAWLSSSPLNIAPHQIWATLTNVVDLQ